MAIAMNMKLVDSALSNIKTKVLNTKSLPRKSSYNCWGFTAAAVGWIDKPIWIMSFTMEDLMRRNSRKVNVPKCGDIIVFRDEDRLKHTAIITQLGGSDNQIVHKPGQCALEVLSERFVSEKYKNYGRVAEYRRPKVLKQIVVYPAIKRA